MKIRFDTICNYSGTIRTTKIYTIVPVGSSVRLCDKTSLNCCLKLKASMGHRVSTVSNSFLFYLSLTNAKIPNPQIELQLMICRCFFVHFVT